MSYYDQAVYDGVLRYVSPSQIKTFTLCPRRWWFQKVAGLEEPSTPAQELGTKMHSEIEAYLNTGDKSKLGHLTSAALEYLPAPGTTRQEVDIISTGLTLRGVPVAGRIDVIDGNEVLDHKTTSDIKYAKTPAALAVDPQMIIYAAAILNSTAAMSVIVSHGYIGTKTRGARKVSALLSARDVYGQFDALCPTVERMQAAAGAKVEDLPANTDACWSYGKRCPFFAKCQGDADLADFLTTIKTSVTTQSGGNTMSLVPKIDFPAIPPPAEPSIGIAPPDAPPPDPVLEVAGEEGQFHTSNGQLYVYTKGHWGFDLADFLTTIKTSVTTQSGGNTMSLVPKIDFPAIPPPAEPSIGIAPPDAPPPDPVLEVAGEEGQFHTSNGQLYVYTKGHWGFAGKDSKEIYAALASPAASTTPEDFDPPKKRGRKPKVDVVVDAPAAVTPGAPTSVMVFAHCTPSIPTVRLEPYIDSLVDHLAKAAEEPQIDIRLSSNDSLAYGKWRGALRMAILQNPPMPGAYLLLGNSEFHREALEALAPMCSLCVRGSY